MKKKLLAVMSVLVLLLAFTACGGKDMSDSPYLGTWTATTAEMSGFEMSVESILGGEFTFTLEDDGNCTMSIAGEEDSGSWDETEDGIIIEDELTMTIDGDVGVMDYEGVSLYFQR